MFSSALNWLLDSSLYLIDTVISWVFMLVPNDFLLDDFNVKLDSLFDYFTEILVPWSYWIDVPLFTYIIYITFWLEMVYILIRFFIWIAIKIIKP